MWFPDVATIATNDVGGKGMGKGFPELLALNTEATGCDMCMPQTGLPQTGLCPVAEAESGTDLQCVGY